MEHQRADSITIDVTSVDRRDLEAAARVCGITVAEYVRRAALAAARGPFTQALQQARATVAARAIAGQAASA